LYQLRWAYTNRETVGIPLSQKISGVMVDVMCRLQQATTRRQPTLATRGNLTVASTWRDLDLNYYFSTHSTDITLNCACQSTLQNVVCRPTRPDITAALTWWHCLHCMHSRVYEMVRCPSVRVSVPAWAHVRKPVTACLLLWARQAGYIDRLLRHRRTTAGSAMLSAYIVAKHWLANPCFSLFAVVVILCCGICCHL